MSLTDRLGVVSKRRNAIINGATDESATEDITPFKSDEKKRRKSTRYVEKNCTL